MVYPTLKPKIEIRKKPMRNLTKDVQAIICKCEEPCKNYLLIDDYGRFCEKDALEIGLSIYSLVEGINRIEPGNQKYGWSVQEEQFIIDFYNKHDTSRYGSLRILATMLHRPYDRTVYKVKEMKRRKLI